MKDKQKSKQTTCLNCGEPLTEEEKERGEGWCDDCNLPERSLYYA